MGLFNHYIRSANNPILQKILQLLRKIDPLSDEEINFIIKSILDNCIFIDSWNDLPDDVVKIVPKKEARQELIQKHISKIKSNNSIKKHIIQSYDEYQEGDK